MPANRVLEVKGSSFTGSLRLLAKFVAVAVDLSRGSVPHGLKLLPYVSAGVSWLKWTIAGIPNSKLPCFGSRLELLNYAAAKAPRNGLWLEFGVWKGESINEIAKFAPGTVYGFDSFEGLPEWWTPTSGRGRFSTSGALPKTANNVALVKGLFRDTLPNFLESNPEMTVTFVHIDSDLYSSASYVLSELARRINSGAVVVFDEFTGLLPDDEARAFREFIRTRDASFEYIGYSASGSIAIKIG
ncbi:MAG: class I SAM-dependent methyltransferase [Thermoplasmata archaeon]